MNDEEYMQKWWEAYLAYISANSAGGEQRWLAVHDAWARKAADLAAQAYAEKYHHIWTGGARK